MLETVSPRNSYLGNNSADTFDFDYKIFAKSQLKVIVVDPDSLEPQILTLNTHYTVPTADLGDETGGSITLVNGAFDWLSAGDLKLNWRLVILRVFPNQQQTDFVNQGSFLPESHEDEFDRRTMIDQWLQDQISRSIRLPDEFDPADFNMELTGGFEGKAFNIIAVNKDEDGVSLMSIASLISNLGGGGVPPGGAEFALLEKFSSADGEADWTDAISFHGISARFGSQQFDGDGVYQVLEQILQITYTPPLISLSASGNSLREKGAAVTSTTLTAAITKKSNDIGQVRFYDVTLGTLLDTQVSGGAIPSGGNSTYPWAGSFSDNHTFRAEVDDVAGGGGPTTVGSNTTFSFVYPYYVGAGAPGLSAAAVAALTKRIINNTNNRVEVIAASNSNVFYFAYPASYGALTSILDVNNFETIGDWTLRTENITGLDGNPVSYRIYEFQNPVSAGSYQYTFIK